MLPVLRNHTICCVGVPIIGFLTFQRDRVKLKQVFLSIIQETLLISYLFSSPDDPWSRSGRKTKVKKPKISTKNSAKKSQSMSSLGKPKDGKNNMTSALLAAGIGQGKTVGETKKDLFPKSDSFTNIPSGKFNSGELCYTVRIYEESF